MTLTKIIHDAVTNEISEIPLTDKEVKEIEKLQAAAAKEEAVFKEAKAQAEADKAALLARLGLTQEEAKLLLS